MAGTYSDTGNIVSGRNIYAADVKGPIDELDTALASLVAGNIALTNAEITNILRFGTPITATLASDALVPSRTLINVSAQSGVTDDLKYITQTLKPMLIIIRPTSGHTITVKHNAAGGNIRLPSEQDFVLSNINQSLMLVTDGSSGWYGLGSANPAGSLALDDLTDAVITSPADHDGLFWDSGTNRWVNGGVPLNFAHQSYVSKHYTTTSTSLVDIHATELSLTITLKKTRMLAVFSTTAKNSNVGADVIFDFALDGTPISGSYGASMFHQSVANYITNFTMMAVIDTTPGSHTVRPRWKTNTGTAYAGNNLNRVTFYLVEID